MKGLLNFIKKIEPDKEKSPLMHTLFDGFFTFLYTPDTTSKSGAHIRDGMDLKRTMTVVIMAMGLCFLSGIYNTGHQHFLALGEYTDLWSGFHLKVAFGLIQVLPLLIVSYVVGLGIEFWYASRKGHVIEEGYLVSGFLIPLIMPPDLPLWILALSVVFAVIIGKEAFGGTGMNILNVALLARVFVFFAYPTEISGDEVWVSGLTAMEAGAAVDYGWWELGFFNGVFEAFGWTAFDPSWSMIDGFTGATPLGLASKGGWDAVTAVYTTDQMWWGLIPGSVGEMTKPFILFGAVLLILTGVGSWRIMVSMFFGAAIMAVILNIWGGSEFMLVPWYYQFYMGSFLFAMAFMATDPVTAASTNTGKWLYGFLIGFIGMIIRVLNPAYPEGWMLAILLLNVFAPLIDHYVLESNMKKRLSRA